MKNCLKGFAIAVSVSMALAALSPLAKAEDVSWPTAVYFDGPMQIGQDVFPAGSYILQRCPNEVTSRLMKIYSVDRGRWEGLIMGVSARRPDTQRDAVVTFQKRGSGQPDALRYWFFESWNIGMEFPASHSTYGQSADASATLVTVTAQALKK
jgi:hypothetical protein